MHTTTPQSLIDEARPLRERMRPTECLGGRGAIQPCWVEAPYAAIESYATRCITCGGYIATRQWTTAPKTL